MSEEEEQIQVIVVDLPSATPSNWDDVEKLLHHGLYNELRIAPEENAVIISESTFSNPVSKEKLTQVMFETFCVPALSILPNSYLAVTSIGNSTGVSIHAGENSVEIVPVINGKVLRDIAMDYPITGSYISGYLQKILTTAFPDQMEKAFKYALMEIKQKKVRVSLDPASEPDVPVMFDLGDTFDNANFDIGKHSWLVMELFLYPEFCGTPHPPLVQAILSLIAKCPEENQRELLKNIVLTGGVAEYPGLKERLEKDIATLLEGFSLQAKVHIQARHGVFQGASILGNNPAFIDKMMSKDAYDEVGPSGIHQFSV